MRMSLPRFNGHVWEGSDVRAVNSLKVRFTQTERESLIESLNDLSYLAWMT